MNKQSTVPILYHGGSYGTYLEWCLTVLTTDLPLTSPFTTIGNSHNFPGHQLGNIKGWRHYVSSPECWKFVRLHPKTKSDEKLKQNLNEISSHVNFFIYIYPSKDTLLLSLINQFTKIWDDWWDSAFNSRQSISSSKIYENWPVPRDVPINQIPVWIKREFLSYYLMPMYFDQIEWDQPEHHNQHNCVFVSLDNLLYDFKNTILGIINQLNLKLIKPIDLLDPYYHQMSSLQTNVNQGVLCKEILDSISNQTLFDWTNQNLTLVSESYLQWQLRNLGYELRCHGLDTFPTNSVQLKELLYTV